MKISKIIYALAHPIDTIKSKNNYSSRIIATALLSIGYLSVLGAFIGIGANCMAESQRDFQAITQRK
ncbi:MAG: hypothetical protein WD595_01785 [Waddliaceae bacterium]